MHKVLTVVALSFYLLGTAASMASGTLPPAADLVVIYKAEHLMELYHSGELTRSYQIHLGFHPKGLKTKEGDGRTPEGLYTINRHNPNSKYHLSLGISYPGPEDKGNAIVMGVPAGGEVMIHGLPNGIHNVSDPGDWTNGCIAVDNQSIEEIYGSVKDGTPVMILP